MNNYTTGTDTFFFYGLILPPDLRLEWLGDTLNVLWSDIYEPDVFLEAWQSINGGDYELAATAEPGACNIAFASTVTATVRVKVRIFKNGAYSGFSDPVTITELIPEPVDLGGYYVSTLGSDVTGDGSFLNPWATWQFAFNQLVAGDILYVRGGTYTPAMITWSGYDVGAYVWNKSGVLGNIITVENYPGETPIMDAINIDGANTSIGLYFHTCNYWLIKGLIVQNSPGFGMELQNCTNSTVELCVFRYNTASGFRVFGTSDDILILNCDAHHNQNEANPGGPDGFEASNITYNAGALRTITFRGCRAWANSDDGFDFWMMEGYLILDGCWSWANGWTDGGLTGDGDGFKLGTTTTAALAVLYTREVHNCVAFDNRLYGISQNQANTMMYIFNNTVFSNYNGLNFWWYDLAHEFRNNISCLNTDVNWNGAHVNAIISNNSYDAGWQPAGPVANGADFKSIDIAGVDGARQVGGALPLLDFLHLILGSDLIAAGIAVGLATDCDGVAWGAPPSIGAYEFV